MDFQALEQALELSQRMLQLTEASDWQALDALDDARKILLDRGLAGTVPAAHRARVRDILQAIEGLNTQTLDLLSQGRDQLYESIQLTRHRQNAASAYISCKKESFSDAE